MRSPFIRREAHVSELSLVRNEDRTMMFVFLLSLVLCAAAIILLEIFTGLDTSAVLLVISIPFLITGLVTYISTGMWKMLLIAMAVPSVLFFVGVPLLVLFFVAFLMIGCVGVVSVSVILQRMVFYLAISTLEYVNIKEKLSLFEKLIVFLFNIPPNIDTRTITMEHNLRRTGIPFREMAGTMFSAFVIGIAIWITVSLNPHIMNTIIDAMYAPIYVFSLVMFIPLVVLPWTPFKSLNVRITTGYRSFSIYGGVVETLRKMAVPIFTVLLFVILAMNRSNFMHVIGYLGLSVAFNLLVVAVSCIIYYLFFESSFVDDAVAKWKVFRPVRISMELTDDINETNLPGTPSRDLSDIGDI